MTLKDGEIPNVLGTAKVTENKPAEIVKPVTNAVMKKRSGIGKLFKNFIAEDVIDVKTYLVKDVLIPSIKNAIADLVISATNMTLFGKNGNVNRFGRPLIGKTGSTLNYGTMYKMGGTVGASTLNGGLKANESQSVAEIYDFNEILYRSWEDAENVYLKLCERISMYNLVTVKYLYDVSGLASHEVTLSNWGWYDIPWHKVEAAGGGYYLLRLPNAVPLNK